MLFVGGDESLLQSVCERLRTDGYRVDAARSKDEAVMQLRASHPDVVILHPALVDAPGFDSVEAFRMETDLPIMVLGPGDQEIDNIVALELGADDYVAKPFGMRELVARVRSLIRRGRRSLVVPDRQRTLRARGLEIDLAKRQVSRDGAQIELRPREFELLVFLVENAGKAFSREQLLNQVWGYQPYGRTRTVDVHIDRLRRKIEDLPRVPRLIITVRGVGYRFDA